MNLKEETVIAIKHMLYTSDTSIAIKFLKKDGTERDMRCTTNLKIIPEDKHPKKIDENSPDYKPRKISVTAIPVFDMDKQEWRSFTKDSLISVNGVRIAEYEDLLIKSYIIL